ncbi:MAG TPA: serine/threonine-protein kinase, partial [Kofleriaceae bacterium]
MTTTQHDSIVPNEWYCPTCEQQFALGDRCPSDGTRLVKVTPRADPLLGRDLEGRYTIVEKLGEGGMGAVYRGTQHSVGREVAIKVITPSLVSQTEVIKRFLREAKLASRLSHPNAVAVLDFGQTADGVFYLAMELVKGRTLDDVFRADGVFRPERVVRIGTQICDALAGAEALKIVHRDLKPSNIMVLAGTRDLIKVLDFGLAKSVAPDSAATTMTGSGALLGTPAFMPPELALGQPCDGRADLYSLGCILYLLAVGQLPFTSNNVHELLAAHASERAPRVRDVPDALADVIARLLEKDPAARYETAAETQAALDAAIDVRA